jgi:steroid 5-alpha reductase family enzyme
MGMQDGMAEADPLSLVVIAYITAAVLMVILWVVQRKTKNAAIGDVGWCVGLIASVLLYITQAPVGIERIMLTAMLVLMYAGRLGHHIYSQRIAGQPEDNRYRRLRKEWGDSESVNMFVYFQWKAVSVAVFSLPFLVVLWNPRIPSAVVEMLGLLIWGLAVSWEAKADRQLAYFRADPRNKGRVCREGLWRYSRHPNYFFDWLHWCSYVVMTLGAPGWLFTWVGPIGMGWLLLRVTGIPRAEREALSTRGEEYKAYQTTTNAFFPWFPRSKSDSATQS